MKAAYTQYLGTRSSAYRARLAFRLVSTARPPSPLIQARELIYSCSYERAGAAPLEAASAAVLTELAPALMGWEGRGGGTTIRRSAINNELSYLELLRRLGRIAKVLTFAGFVEPYVLLEILVCKTLVQKFIFLPGFLPRPGAGSEHRLCAGIDPRLWIMTAGIADFERDLIGDRTSAGCETARRREIQLACLRKLTYEHAKLVRRLLNERKSVREIAGIFNVHTATIYRLSATVA